jgi:hypothetical protein
MNEAQIFVSAVSDEFSELRKELQLKLQNYQLAVLTQENIKANGGVTAAKLDTAIAACEAVIHLVGSQTGYPANDPSVEWIQQKSRAHTPQLPSLVEALAAILDRGADGYVPASYTQWEAYLALTHGKKLFIARWMPASPLATLAAQVVASPAIQSQHQHLARLKQAGSYQEIEFDSVDTLVTKLWESEFRYILQKAGRRPRIRNVGISIKEQFIGRETFLSHIYEKFIAGHHQQVLYGLGGAGKTRMAIEYAQKQEQLYEALLFVQADTVISLEAGLAALGGPRMLRLPEHHTHLVPEQLGAVQDWLETHSHWLLILDNVDTEEVARQVVADWLPHLSKGHLLITSRLNAWAPPLHCIEVQMLSKEDSARFLIEQTRGDRPGRAGDQDAAADLARDLGGLALALEQARSYIVTERVTLRAYHQQWVTNAQNIRAWVDRSLLKSTEKSVATTWKMSFEKLSPEAQNLLRRLAWLAAEPVPRALLTVAMPWATSVVLNSAFRDLILYSLASYATVGGEVFAVHRLVQEVTRAELVAEARQLAFAETLAWMLTAWQGQWANEEGEDIPDFLPHTTELVTKYLGESCEHEPVRQPFELLTHRWLLEEQAGNAAELLKQALAAASKISFYHPSVRQYWNLLSQQGHPASKIAALLEQLGIRVPETASGEETTLPFV